MSVHVRLYSKEDCHLCHLTRAELYVLETELGITVEEVDITLDERLFARFRYLIPVIDIDGEIALMAPIDPVELRTAVDDAIAKAASP